ncbi:hypothetical protein MKI79_07895 [Acinetobacter sp. A3.8]|uniref:Uncharacterized protein n=1 Tax=Acinetobacter sedimenti TaxID=2919922 RepID=A0A9X1WXJ0_9GAMM|nr:hypothetical protein [Acinetobacter sedimenti]MCJ8146821.1 hypothetical protein [Acinetobacter sedimenti]
MMNIQSNYKRTEAGTRELTQRQLKINARTRTLLLLLEKDDIKQLSIDASNKIANAENFQTLLDLGLIYDTTTDQPTTLMSINEIASHKAESNSQRHLSDDLATEPTNNNTQPKPNFLSKVSRTLSQVNEALQSERVERKLSSTEIASKANFEAQPDKVVENETVQSMSAEIKMSEPAKQRSKTIEPVSPFKAPTPIPPKPEPLAEEKSSVATIGFEEVKSLMQQTLQQYCGLMAKALIVAIGNAENTHQLRQYQSKWLTSLFETRIGRQQLNELLSVINASLEHVDHNQLAS